MSSTWPRRTTERLKSLGLSDVRVCVCVCGGRYKSEMVRKLVRTDRTEDLSTNSRVTRVTERRQAGGEAAVVALWAEEDRDNAFNKIQVSSRRQAHSHTVTPSGAA